MPYHPSSLNHPHTRRAKTNVTLLDRCAVLLVLLIAIIMLSSPQALANTESDPESELSEISKAIGKLTNWIKGAEGRKKDLEKKLKNSELKISRVTRSLHNLKASQKVTKQKISELEVASRKLEQASQQQKSQLIKQIQASHQMGITPAMKALLTAESPHQFSRITTYMDYVNQARKKQLDAFSQSLKAVADNREKTEKQRAKLKQQEATLLNKQKEQGILKRKRAATLAKLERELGKSSNKLERLKQDRLELESVVEAARKAIIAIKPTSDNRPFKKLKGQLPWPTTGKVTGGYRGLVGSSSLRANGITIKAASGSPVTAIHYGQIVFSDWLRGFGLMIIVDHGDGYMSLYGHNDSLNKDVGDWVNAAEVIASVGNSGGARESSLYFEIRKNGTPQNPNRWLKKSK